MSKVINELSLLPNLGLKTNSTMGTVSPMGTTGTTASINTPGSKVQTIAKTTAATTKQINDLVNKIAMAKAKAQQAGSNEQKALLQSVSLLQSQLQQLVSAEQEETYTVKKKNNKNINNIMDKPRNVKEGVVGVLKKGAGAAAGGYAGKLAGTVLGGPLGGLAGSVIGSGIGAEVMDDDEESCNKKRNKAMKKKRQKVAEGILPAVGKAASTAVKTAGNVAGMVPVVGAPVKAAADLAGDIATGVMGGENEEGADKLTPIQDEVVDVLVRNKYYINRVSYQFAEEEGGPTVFMSKKPNRYSTRYAEVGPDGFVNGESIEDFLKGHEENEEKMLSKKQQRIAKLGGDPNKIDGADFARLRAMKSEDAEEKSDNHCEAAEEGCDCDKCDECKDNQTVKENVAEIPSFLRAILQKNYAEADKYLGSVINEKLKKLINTALDKNL
jgi:hypothetical protein